MKSNSFVLLKIAAVLWVIWGLVHMLAGFIVLSEDTAGAIAAIADAVDPETIKALVYPPAAGGVINQHGYNLFIAGATTTIGAYFVWKASVLGIFVSAFVGGLFDIGYFIFIDLAGFANFVPGTVMTLICASAIALSFYTYFTQLKKVS